MRAQQALLIAALPCALRGLDLFAHALPAPAHGVTSDHTKAANQTFDYIVVGGGLTGTVVASRLSEDPDVSVLLIEAGGDSRKDPRVYDILQALNVYFTDLDWAWPADQGTTIAGGRTLGGSSSINGALYTRAPKEQYDVLSQLLDAEEQHIGWDSKGLFTYMKKSETFTPPNATQSSPGASYIHQYHGYRGPLQVSYPQGMFIGPHLPAIVEAAQEVAGIPYSRDINGGDPAAASLVPMTLNPKDSGHRCSAAQAYLTPVEGRRHNWLTIVEHTVTKINFKRSSRPLKAAAVEFARENNTTHFRAFASREVILAAGAISTPALLQRSGIGDSSHLESLGISTLLDLKTVGRNLQEQSQNLVFSPSTDADPLGTGPAEVIVFSDIYQLFGQDAGTAVATIRSSLSAWAKTQAESAADAESLRKILKLQSDLIIKSKSPVFELYWVIAQDLKLLGSSSWQLLPFSRGTVRINSTDPFTKPQINVNYFSIDFDMKTQVYGTRLARKMLQSQAMKSIVTNQEVSPGSAVPDDDHGGSEQDWSAWIRSSVQANAHPVGTAAMMKRILGGVVNARLKVYDTTNLRIIDASILPLQLSAHLSATLYGVAEKAADLIKEDWA